MKLVGELKEKVEQAENLKEAKRVIENAGMELTDEEMEAVSGGAIVREGPTYGVITDDCLDQEGYDHIAFDIPTLKDAERIARDCGVSTKVVN